jgi:hypothetical protein
MTEPVAKRTRAPAAIALAIMLAACALIVTALALLAQGAVAAELRDTAPSAGRPLISDQTKERGLKGDQPPDANAPADRPAAVTGSFTLGAAPSPAEQALEAAVAASSAGGGFVAGGQIHVVVEDRAAGETAQP